jgi:tetratricopeptide (TPR) repeat protein
MTLLLALVVALIPLIIAPGLFFYFDVTPKIVLLLLGTAAAAVWWAWKGGRIPFYQASREARWFLWAMCGMAVSLIVSTVASVNRAVSLGGSNWRYWGLITQLAALGFACLAAAICLGRPSRMRLMLRAIAVSGLIAALYGIAQYFGWDPVLDARAYHVGEGVFTIVRPPSTLGHADYFANWLLCVVFATAALITEQSPSASSLFWKWLAWISLAVSVIAILLSGTRAALVGLIAGGLWLVLWRGLRVTRRMAATAIVVVCAAAVFYLSPAGALLRARVHWALEEPAGGARLLLWRDSLRMASARLAAGYGPDTYIGAFARTQSADLGKAYPDFYHESPHNIFIDALVSQGVAGPLLLLALCAVGFAAAWRARPNPVAAALASGLLAMTVGEQFACFMLPTALAYFVTIALLVSITGRASPRPVTVARRWPRLAAVLPCATLLVFFGLRLTMAEIALGAVRRDLDANQVGDAENQYAQYQRWRWPGGSADLWYSRRLAQLAVSHASPAVRFQAFQLAGLAAQRATGTVEDPFNAYYNLAAYYARLNDFAHTEQCLRSAVSYAPNWFKPHWMLAQVLRAASRPQDAQAEAETAVALDGGKHAEVTGTLEHIRADLRATPVEPPHK